MKPHLLFLTLTLLLFSCGDDDDAPRALSVTTSESDIVTHNSISIGGRVTGNPIDEVGVVWAQVPNPSLDDNKVLANNAEEGSFGILVDDLNRNVTYHFRAYAIQDGQVVYGENKGVTTSNFVGVPYSESVVLFVAPTDNAREVAWGPTIYTGAESSTDGASNTALLTAEGNQFIARICAQYSGGGFTDWYLPAEVELKAIAAFTGDIGGVQTPGYWSSTEVSSASARAVNIVSGTVSSAPKGTLLNCRCVRKETVEN